MHIRYLEIVANDVDTVCAIYTSLYNVSFCDGESVLGGARTAELPHGGTVGVRAPMHESEEPVVRPYMLVDDIELAVSKAVEAGAEVAHPPTELPGHGTFAILIQGGVQTGLWQD